MHQYRQGDVLLLPTDIPKDATITTKDEIVLAEGEATGHAHRITLPGVEELAKDGVRYLRTHDVALVKHEEHDTVAVPPGEYKIVQQREYSPTAIRAVAD